jgi:hypothetical protein
VNGELPPGRSRADETEDIDLDEDLDEFLEAWDEVDRAAAAVLCNALGDISGRVAPSDTVAAIASGVRDGLRERHHPFGWIRRAAALEEEPLPADDTELLLRCAAATISPQQEAGLDVEEEALLVSLEHADWLGAIISVTRRGPGEDASPKALVEGICTCPEVELESDLDLDEESHLETAFWIVALPWHVLGLTDRDQRLTSLGAWVLPRALARAWGANFDAGGD